MGLVDLSPGIITWPDPGLLLPPVEIAGNQPYDQSIQMSLPGDPIAGKESYQESYEDGQPERHRKKEKQDSDSGSHDH
jgi:hypothetical protein